MYFEISAVISFSCDHFQITELVRRTIDNLIESFSNKLTTPFLLLEGEYSDLATIVPSVDMIADKYQSLLEYVSIIYLTMTV